jgi:hypothetical protein
MALHAVAGGALVLCHQLCCDKLLLLLLLLLQ